MTVPACSSGPIKPMIHGPTCRKRHVEYDKNWGCLIVYHHLKHHRIRHIGLCIIGFRGWYTIRHPQILSYPTCRVRHVGPCIIGFTLQHERPVVPSMDVECHVLPYLRNNFPQPSTDEAHKGFFQNAIMIVEKLLKTTSPSWLYILWHANPLCNLLSKLCYGQSLINVKLICSKIILPSCVCTFLVTSGY